LAIAGLMLVLGCAVWLAWRWQLKGRVPAGAAEVSLALSTPYRNVQPDVKYAGDESCALCHVSQAATYRQHPMGRSLMRVSQSPPVEREDATVHNPFDSLGYHFTIQRRGTRMVHKAGRLDPQGRVVAELETPVEFVVGSGTRGRSYLINRDNYLFQSPISWFTQQQAWDLSPVFASFYPPERVVEVSCLFCHANQVEAVPQTRNHYRPPLFRGHTIGCERCHGPGELHVQSRARGDVVTGAIDDTIVNPRHLSPVLREGVCQQCHLQGKARFLRPGRQPFDYRPGLPLHQFWSILVGGPGFPDYQKAIGQVEQLYLSRCFQASDGKLGCISCHDPHALPAPEERVSYYRRRCLNCHQEQSCALNLAERRQQRPDDSCMACHMRRLATADIAHTALTDHRILRRADVGGPAPDPSPDLPPGEVPIVNFYQKELDPQDPGLSRDLGVALSYLTRKPGPLRQQASSRAVPLLEKAFQSAPEDDDAQEALGWVLTVQGRNEEALAAYDALLARQPERELTLSLAATLAEGMGRSPEAITYLRRAIAVNPWIWEYHYHLAKLLAERHDWPAALAECEGALRLSPGSEPTRVLLIPCCLHTGQKNRAERELQILVDLSPKEEKALRSWFAGQMP
jgi:tetratricopeptide (TPR) repeat protein